jgi:cytochrome d ubiquinol oxidase subunit II
MQQRFLARRFLCLLLGVALGNLVWGIPLDAGHELQGDVFTLLHPYALFTGVTVVALFIMHANVYLVLKTDGPLQEKVMRWTRITVPAYLACFVVFNAITLLFCPHIEAALRWRPLILGAIFVVGLLVTFNILREVRKGNAGRAFVSSVSRSRCTCFCSAPPSIPSWSSRRRNHAMT